MQAELFCRGPYRPSLGCIKLAEAAIRLIEQTAQAQRHCPSCKASHVHRHGQAHGLQRYRCARCGRTFNAVSGRPLPHLRYQLRWLAYADCLHDITEADEMYVLDTGRPLHQVAGKLAQSRSRRFSKYDSDIAID